MLLIQAERCLTYELDYGRPM